MPKLPIDHSESSLEALRARTRQYLLPDGRLAVGTNVLLTVLFVVEGTSAGEPKFGSSSTWTSYRIAPATWSHERIDVESSGCWTDKFAGAAGATALAPGSGPSIDNAMVAVAAQQLATATSAVRSQLFEQREEVQVAWIGGVYRSEMLLERFRLLVELEDGNRVIAPRHGPAAGALIEAYAAAGAIPELRDAPAEKD